MERQQAGDAGPGTREGETTGVAITMAVATCGRPSALVHTLDSLAAQRFAPGSAPRLSVAVVDNHARATAAQAVAQLVEAGFPHELRYEHEPTPGISFARNRLVRMAAGSDYVAFIDDDEVASPQWIAELLQVANHAQANVVLGPVVPVLGRPEAGWMRPLFERPRHSDGAIVGPSDFRTSNVLIRCALLDPTAGSFDPEFALLGGSDTLLGQQLHGRGERFAWADRALVLEHVEEDRQRLGWFLKRRYRSGVVFARVNRRMRGPVAGALPSLYRGLGSIAYGELSLLLGLPQGRLHALQSAGLILYGMGNLSGLFGHFYHEYAGRSEA